jgi:hypothetical protein
MHLNLLQLDLVEENSRKNLLQDLTDAIIAKWPQAQVFMRTALRDLANNLYGSCLSVSLSRPVVAL